MNIYLKSALIGFGVTLAVNGTILAIAASVKYLGGTREDYYLVISFLLLCIAASVAAFGFLNHSRIQREIAERNRERDHP